jgi:ABC-type transport system involved in cytochrome c biogenesis permease subunit
MSATYLSDALLLSTLLVYGLSVLAFAAAAGARRITPRPAGAGVPVPIHGPDAALRLGNIAVALTVLAFGAHAAALVARGVAAGRPPLGNMFEFAVATSLAAVIALLLVGRRARLLHELGLLVVLPVTVTLGFAVVVLYTQPGALVPALRSAWLSIHVSAAAAAMGALTVATVANGLQVLRRRRGGEGVPAVDLVARISYDVAFPLWTFAVMAGAIWAERAWGRFWGWDPKEVWALVTWVLLAAYLHARRTTGVRRGVLALLGLLGYGCLVFNFVAVNVWFDGLHGYSGL